MSTPSAIRVAASFLKQAAFTPEAQIILDHMGGYRRIAVMLGIGSRVGYAYYNLTGAHGPGVGFTFPNKHSSKGNCCEIKLDVGSDTYVMSFFRVTVSGKQLIRKIDDVYSDSLVEIFEHQTGLFLRF